MRKTEQHLSDFAGLDTWEDQAILTALLEGQATAIESVRAALGTISEVSPSLANPWIRCEIEGKNQEGRQILTGSCALFVPARNPLRTGGKS